MTCPRSCAAVAAAVLAGLVTAAPAREAPVRAIAGTGVTILAYHRFGAMVNDAMTVRTSTFRWQLDYLRQRGYSIIPLRRLITSVQRRAPEPSRSVVITVDDGHASVFTELLPIVREYGIPVTLFIYPSAISNASYAMTWEQLAALDRTGLFDIQSHTYWHPNFKVEKRRLSGAAYRAFATLQLARSRAVLKDKTGVEADVLAWPFGIYDDELIGMARDAGYVAGVTLDRRISTSRDQLMALPRFLVTDAASGRHFTSMLPREDR